MIPPKQEFRMPTTCEHGVLEGKGCHECLAIAAKQMKKPAPAKKVIPPGLQKTNEHRQTMADKNRDIDLAEADRQLAEKESATEIIRNKTAVASLCAEMNHDPMKRLIQLAVDAANPKKTKNTLNASDEMRLNFKIADKIFGDVKSVDGEGDSKMHVSITMQSFKGTKIEDLETAHRDPEEYEGFDDGDSKVNSGQSDGTIQFDNGQQSAGQQGKADRGQDSEKTAS